MITLIHVLIAISSVAIASVTFFKPSVCRLIVSYGFIIATVASGTYLLLTTPGDILRSCLSGLLYVTAVTIVTIATHLRVRRQASVGIDE